MRNVMLKVLYCFLSVSAYDLDYLGPLSQNCPDAPNTLRLVYNLTIRQPFNLSKASSDVKRRVEDGLLCSRPSFPQIVLMPKIT